MNITSNSTDEGPRNVETAFLISGSFLAVICPLTVLANLLLIVAICRDPFKTFRTPTACFLVGLAFTDLITGLVPEPMIIACYFLVYKNHSKKAHCPKIFETAGYVAAITTNASFFIVMAFTFAQYIAVAFPLKYKRLISVPKSAACVAIILLYATIFEVPRALGAPQEVIERIDLHLHSTFSLLLTIITYLLLQRAFRKQMAERSVTLSTTEVVNTESTDRRASSSQKQKPPRKQMIEKTFVRLNLLLIVILLVCSQPSAICWYVYLYAGEGTRKSPTLFIIRVIADNTLYLKFLLDPFVFAWRLPKYRRALKRALCREG